MQLRGPVSALRGGGSIAHRCRRISQTEWRLPGQSHGRSGRGPAPPMPARGAAASRLLGPEAPWSEAAFLRDVGMKVPSPLARLGNRSPPRRARPAPRACQTSQPACRFGPTFPDDDLGPEGQSWRHSSRGPRHAGLQGATDLEGPLPLTWGPILHPHFSAAETALERPRGLTQGTQPAGGRGGPGPAHARTHAGAASGTGSAWGVSANRRGALRELLRATAGRKSERNGSQAP